MSSWESAAWCMSISVETAARVGGVHRLPRASSAFTRFRASWRYQRSNGMARMDFALPPQIEDTRARIGRFVDERLIPLEADPNAYDAHENLAPGPLAALRDVARSQGLWALRM